VRAEAAVTAGPTPGPTPEPTQIDAVAVVVPARDEQDTIVECLRSVRAALRELPPTTATAVTIVLDRCVDDTAALVAAELGNWPQARALHVPVRVDTGVGAVRDIGARAAFAQLPVPAERVWMLCTDADSAVPPDWAIDHLRYAATGVVAVAGIVDLAGPGPQLHAACEPSCDGHRHDHVYGANLGVRADAYLAVGGFPPGGAGEDAALWRGLTEAGVTTASPTSVRVRTSARLHGRARGGLADLLRARHGA